MKRLLASTLIGAMAVSMIACGTDDVQVEADTEENVTAESESSTEVASAIDVSYAEDTDALVENYADKFEQVEYTDSETGLTVTYNIFLPEDYDESEEYPMVVFIADSSCVGDDATTSLTQGRGALVWAADEWQSVNPSIVLVPSYPETILDDQNGYSTTEYVELTKRLIDTVSEEYAVDTDRIYGTGQSMGCMTTLILASEYPDLYAACMFVDGQWDVSTLSALEDQTFIYFAAEDDTSAYAGLQEVMDMFDEDGVDYTYAQWDGTWTTEELTSATEELISNGTNAYFVSWKTGAIEPSESMSFGGGGQGFSDDSDGEKPSKDEMSDEDKPSKEGMSENEDDSFGGQMPGGGGDNSMMESVQYHMASFDYAYRCISVMEWLFTNSN